MDILRFIFTIIEVVVLFNVIIIVHELGHFWAARWRGLVVERFGIWFGKPLWEKEINGVKYSLGCIPAGGFVALPQMAPMELLEGETETDRKELPQASVLDRIIVAFAGPLFSFMLAIFFACLVSLVGRPVSEGETTTIVGYMPAESPALAAGLRPGDKILAIDGNEVSRFGGVGDTVTWQIVSSENPTIKVTYERAGEVSTIEAEPYREETKAYQRKSLRKLQIAPMQRPLVTKVLKDMPAGIAGIEPGDVIVAINGARLFHFTEFMEYTDGLETTPFDLTVLRDGNEQVLGISPVMSTLAANGAERPVIGIEWDGSGHMSIVRPNPIDQVQASVMSMVNTFKALFSPKSEISAQHLAGPTGIMRLYYQLFSADNGWRLAIWFSVIFNVNLALLNMLPIPVLDGGHITMALYEGITRRAINVRFLQWVQSGCAIALICFMLYVTFFDLQDFSWKNPFSKEDAVTIEPAVVDPGEATPAE